ncbi:MAG TPA: class I SAM-dependent methyltransferase [Ferruginibacter sp.]|nr:class I SAM-dependent methyltransferase [Ferruginibacter sp.]
MENKKHRDRMNTEIVLVNPFTQAPLQKNAAGLQGEGSAVFPYRNGAYRIVPEDNYTQNFGYQWNKFASTQIDREQKNSKVSYSRFFAETGWDKEDLQNKNVLEVGSGAGRFSQIILDHTSANLYSVDYSNAVEANFKNNGHHQGRLQLFQASVYDLPFAKGQFDKVFCFGVIQHTPDVKKTVQSLIEMAKPGAQVIVDFYCVNGWWTKLQAKYLLRPITKKWSNEKLLNKIEKNIDWMIATTTFFNKIGIGRFVNRFIPVCDIRGTMPQGLSKSELREWCILDTFDMFSPQYDQPQKVSTVKKWFEQNGMEQVWGGPVYFDNCVAYVVKGVKK